MNKSTLFSLYNRLRGEAHRNPTVMNLARLNKALGIAQSKTQQGEDAQYGATTSTCGCKDWEFRGTHRRGTLSPCKHQLAQILLEVADAG